ncbi:MAG: hypothetical protein ABSA30_06005 [Candidatus Aminicenantales bacterium]
MARLLFWISAGFTVYVYIGYPMLLRGLQALLRPSPGKQPIEPSVSLLVAAYNEAAVIADKIRNGLALDYPAGKLEIVIASDGSKDATLMVSPHDGPSSAPYPGPHPFRRRAPPQTGVKTRMPADLCV